MDKILYYGGIVLMAIAVFAAVITGILLSKAGRKLQAKLEQEFGEKRH